MKTFSAIVLSALAVLPYFSLVSAHGFVSQVSIDGKVYKGNEPNNPKFDSPIRLINDISPVKGANNPNIVCGQNAQKAKLVADAKPGSKVAFSWLAGGGQKWPHNTGPMITYMAECTGTTCDKFDASKAKWFKIHEVGKKSDGKTWVQQDIMNGGSLTVPIPDNLKSGEYLMRHEIVALHLANTKGGAEFYPSCTQVRVTGSGTAVPSSTVSFPGAYKDTDPGIFDPSVFDAKAKYTFPGPAVAQLSAGGRSTAANSTTSDDDDETTSASGASATKSASSTEPSATKAASSSSGSSSKNCKSKRAIVDETGKTRHFSRIMGRIMH
ncbi:hypothetical protein K474DRAFT_361962 [Panus rudis PR-1116 ss-1]|nr:hypothetical protein K474DRAFT_361962 [Panus rudis PR-1116 ss-1]